MNWRKRIIFSVIITIFLFINTYKVPSTAINSVTETNNANLINLRSGFYFSEDHSLLNSKRTFFFEDMLDWGVDNIDAEHVWGGYENAVGIHEYVTGQGVKVAVIDSGIYFYEESGELHVHEDLDGSYAGGYDFFHDDNIPDDYLSHGTHCAGIIAADDDGDGVIGVAPEAELYVLSVSMFSSPSNMEKNYNDVLAALDWVITNNIQVVSMSWGLPDYNDKDEALEAKINEAWNAGIVLVAASGNDNMLISQEPYNNPSSYENTITVGNTDEYNVRYITSNYGPELDLTAPGRNIYSSIPDDDPEGHGDHGIKSGTSMACPMVAGVCVLLLDDQPSLEPDEVRTILQRTARDFGDPGKDDYYGYGIVDAESAVESANTDSDSDTICDILEIYLYATNPNDADSDNDGISDSDEIKVYGTNPTNSDSDYDGLSDEWEITHINPNTGEYFNPLDQSDGLMDHDSDNISTGNEVSNYGTDWNDPDTDNDGLNDGQEVYIYITDPADPDSDNDGLFDGIEIYGYTVYDPENFFGGQIFTSDPTDPDSDNDGLSDGLEALGSDPNDIDSDNDGYTDYEEFNAGTNPRDPNSKPGGGGWFFP